MTELTYEAELERCKRHVKEFRACLKALHGDLCHVQVALQDIEVDIYSIERDYDRVLSSLEKISVGVKEDARPPNPPTTPTTPRAPWHQAVRASTPDQDTK